MSKDRPNTNITFAFGHAVGAGVAKYDEAQSLDAATWAAFLAWDVDFFASETNKAGKSTGKSLTDAIWAIYMYQDFWETDTNLNEYDLVKAEAVLAVDFENGSYYVGHIDELLCNKYSGALLVKENKTTGSNVIDPCQYSNSDQALSYAVVVDTLGATSYDVLYTVYSSTQKQWLAFSFTKGGESKAEWLQDQLLQQQQRNDYTELNFFPKRGASCYSFMRRCEFYGMCDMTSNKSYGSLAKATSFADIEKAEPIDYKVTLSQLVAAQKERTVL